MRGAVRTSATFARWLALTIDIAFHAGIIAIEIARAVVANAILECTAYPIVGATMAFTLCDIRRAAVRERARRRGAVGGYQQIGRIVTVHVAGENGAAGIGPGADRPRQMAGRETYDRGDDHLRVPRRHLR